MIFTYQMLKDAWRKTVVQSSEELNRARFRYYLPMNLFKLIEELNNRTFKPMPLRLETVMYPKKRVVQVPTIKDKIIQHAICDNLLNKELTKPLIKETSACLEGKGTRYAAKLLKCQLGRHFRKHGKDFYVLKCDIKSYFASIPHDRLYKLIDRYVSDPIVIELMHKYVGLMPVGLALGLQQSQLLANLFLSELDHRCKEVLHAELYGRYMDDFYIISNDRSYLEECYIYIKSYVESIGLMLNPKTRIYHNKIDFLGFTFYLTDSGKTIMRLEKSKRKSKHRHLHKLLKMLESGEITIDKFVNSYGSWRVHALEGNCFQLIRKWDMEVSESVKKLGYILIFTKRKVTYVKNDL